MYFGLTYDGGDGKLVLTSVLEQTENIVADNDAGLAGQNILDAHFCCVVCVVVVVKVEESIEMRSTQVGRGIKNMKNLLSERSCQ